MSAITPLRFTGVSTFSEDFQAILKRATQIASLPLQELQNQQANLITKKQSLTALASNIQDLTEAVERLGEVGRTRSLSVTSSNANKVSVVHNGISSSTVYSITEISSVAKAASETSSTGLATADATAVDTDDDLELVFGDETFALDLSATSNSLEGLRDAINASGASVTATVLNTGSKYYLSVAANAPGATALQVRTTAGNAASNLLTTTNQGANAKFKLNGLDVEKTDNVISDVVPGLTFTILDTTEPEETVRLTATSSRGTLATAINQFVTAYNATRAKLNLHIGENAGLLSGDFLVGETSRVLRELTGFAGSGQVKSLADVGVELDKTGVMSFNSTKFYSAATATIESAYDFFGTESTGFGGVSRRLDQISNPITGMIRTQQNNYDAADVRIQKQVEQIKARVERLQTATGLKLQQADSLLAGLQSQQTLLEASIKSVNYALYGKNDK